MEWKTMVGGLTEFWTEWIYDSNHLPIKMQPHPHTAFKVGARASACIFGTVIPFGFFLTKNKGDMEDFLHWLIFVAIWLLVVYNGTTSKEPSFRRYIVRGLTPSVYLVVLYQLLP